MNDEIIEIEEGYIGYASVEETDPTVPSYVKEISEEDAEKLKTLENYDDTEIRNNITDLQNNKADKTEIPTSTSQLLNDSDFVTTDYVDNAVGGELVGTDENPVLLSNLDIGTYVISGKVKYADSSTTVHTFEKNVYSVIQKKESDVMLFYVMKPYNNYTFYYISRYSLNSVQNWNFQVEQLVLSIGDQEIGGTKTFNDLPLSSKIPTTDNQLTNKQYVDTAIQSAIGSALEGSY